MTASPDAFWRWFSSVADELAPDFCNEALLDELQARVSSLGPVTWELGPGTGAESFLAISPDGERDHLDLTRRIVALAPAIAGWEFHAARPARPWSPTFSIGDTMDSLIEVNAGAWRYVLLRYDDGMFELVLEQSGFTGVSDDDRYTAAVVLLDGLLGEEVRLDHLVGITCVETLSSAHAAKAGAVTHLADHLASFRGGPAARRN